MIMIGIRAITVPAATSRGSVDIVELRYCMPTVSVYLSGSLRTTSGHRKSSQAPMNENTATTEAMPLMLGHTMWRIFDHVFAPSTVAASKTDGGTARQAVAMSRTLMAPTTPGMATPASVFARPIPLMTRYWLVSVTSPGSRRTDSRMPITTFLPRNFMQVNA